MNGGLPVNKRHFNKLYYMVLGIKLHKAGVKDLDQVCEVLSKLKRSATEYKQQCDNISEGHGTVNGEYYQGDLAVFVEEKKKVQDRIIKRLQWIKDAKPDFWSDGSIDVYINGVYIDLEEFNRGLYPSGH
jgi:hypothetical protein